MTLKDVLDDYIADLRVRAKRSSVRIAEVHCRTLSRKFPVATIPADSINRAMVNELVSDLRLWGMRDTSINGVLRVLRAALRLAGLATPVKLLTETRKLPTALTEDELRRLIERADTSQARLAIKLAAYAGLRRTEILKLTWGDVNFNRSTLRVAAKADWTPKNHAEREIPLNGELLEALRDAYRPDGSVDTRVIWDKHVLAEVRVSFIAAGLGDPDTKPGLHMLRRTFATRLLGTGTDIETVRQLGGWADLETVQRYITSTTDLKRAAVERLT